MNKQDLSAAEKTKEEALKRVEYDAIAEGLSAIHYHMSLCVFLLILTLLNLPTVLSWANNTRFVKYNIPHRRIYIYTNIFYYRYSRSLVSDPSFIPAIATLFSLAIIWQLPSPRNM